MDVGLDGPHRALDDQPHSHRRREMEDHIALVDQLAHGRGMMDALDRVMEPGMTAEMPDIVDAPGRQIIEDDHLVAPPEISLGQMRPDETRAAGDQYPHR